MTTRCEDYPCCGHTDGLGCNWTYTPEAREFDMMHATCDHEARVCDAYDDEPDDYCCDAAWQEGTNDIPGLHHDDTCDNYDGAPVHQWEVTSGWSPAPDTRGKHDPTL